MDDERGKAEYEQQLRQVEQASPAAIAVLGANGQAYRLEFTDACPGVNEAEQVRLDAPDGWACGSPGERLVVDGRTCAVASPAASVSAGGPPSMTVTGRLS